MSYVYRFIYLLITILVLGQYTFVFAQQVEFEPEKSVVKIRVSNQSYNAINPWKKNDFRKKSGYGCVLNKQRILTTADVVANHILIEVEKAGSSTKVPANLLAVDYDANLAVLSVNDKEFFQDLQPVEFMKKLPLKGPAEAIIFEHSNEVRSVPGKISRVSVVKYKYGWNKFPGMEITINFQGKGGGWGEPVFVSGKLLGITWFYGKNQVAGIIPYTVIEHFLIDLEDGEYNGFVHPGFKFWKLEDSALRSYLSMPSDKTGIYITRIIPGGSAYDILKRGDVLLSLDGVLIDNDGYYLDKDLGRQPFLLLLTDKRPGDKMEAEILREGQVKKVVLVLKRFMSGEGLIPMITIDKQPDYCIEGGLIIQELTLDYLKSWGEDWQKRANTEFLFYYINEREFSKPDKKKLVILNRVLPDKANLGYQDLSNKIIVEVNDRSIASLEDVPEAMKYPVNGLHSFRFKNGVLLVLKDSDLQETNNRIKKKYFINKLSNL